MSRTFDLDALRAFVAVVEERGFRRAGEVLNLSSSGVSMRIRRLEGRDGMRLFERSQTGVTLTSQGRALLPYARRLLAVNDEARDVLCGSAGVRSHLRLGAMEDYAHRILPALLAEYAALDPSSVVEVDTGSTSAMLRNLGDRYDLLLATHEAGKTTSGTLLGTERPIWVAAPAFDLPRSEPVPVALYGEACLFRRWGLQALERNGIKWRPVYASASQAMVEAAVAGGLGCTQARASALGPGLCLLDSLPALPPSEVRLHVAPQIASAGQRFAAFLRERLRNTAVFRSDERGRATGKA